MIIEHGTDLQSPVNVTVTGAPVHKDVRVDLVREWGGRTYCSYAIFAANDQGKVSTAFSAPKRGAYSGVDADGLFYSSKPCPKNTIKKLQVKHDDLSNREPPPRGTLYFIATSGDEVAIATKNIPLLDPNGVEAEIDPLTDVVGNIYRPTEETSIKSAIIVIPGSSPNPNNYRAYSLAKLGYVVLDLRYFGSQSLPNCRYNIEIEYFEKAIALFREYLDSEIPISLIGASAGTEAILLSLQDTETRQEVSAAVLMGTTGIYRKHRGTKGCNNENENSAWTINGAPVPGLFDPPVADLNALTSKETKLYSQSKGTLFRVGSVSEQFRLSLKSQPEILEEFKVPVSNIDIPILFIVGEDDQSTGLWAAQMQFNDRQANGIGKDDVLSIFEGAGHQMGSPIRIPRFSPEIRTSTRELYTYGGSPATNNRAASQLNDTIVTFLEQHTR